MNTTKEIKVIRFRLDLAKVDSLFLNDLAIRPCATLRAFEHQSTFEKSTGYCDGPTYRTISFIEAKYPYERNPCGIETVATNAVHVLQFRHNNGLLEDLFTPNVAVGDLLVPVMNGNEECETGFICGEGNAWKRVYLADNTEYHAETDQTPCMGSEYARAALDYLKQSKAA